MSVDSCHVTDDWKVYQLQELCDGGTLPYGIVQPGAHDELGTPIVRVNNFRGNYIDCSDLLKVKPEISEKYKRTILKGNEVLLTIVGSVGQVACTNSSHVGFNVARAIAVIRPNNLIEAKWIALSLESPQAKETLLGGANTTVQTTINLKELRQLQIAVPPKSYRLKVINLFQSLEQLIENLRVQNTTLEALAQTLFRSWFVNFDPVHAKAAGQTPEGMSPELAALFPSEFVESELGMIPKGWEVKSVDSFLFRHKPKKRFDSSHCTNDMGTPVFDQSANIFVGYTQECAEIPSSIQTPSFIFGDHTCVTTLCPEPFNISANVIALRGANIDSYWSFFAIKDLQKFESYRRHWSELAVRKVVMPPLNIAEKFGGTVSTFFSQKTLNQKLTFTLNRLRDELLPRLISGKLRIEEAEEAVAEVLGSTIEEESA